MIIENNKTLKLFRKAGLCELCGLYCPRREAHHVGTRGHSGGSRLDIPAALLSLCPHWTGNDCHRLHGDDPEYLDTFLGLIAFREGFESGQALQEYLWLVLRTPKGAELPVMPVRF